MNSSKKRPTLFAAAVLLAVSFSLPSIAADKKKAAVPAGQSIVEHGWQKRCEPVKDKKDPAYCEIFQRMDTQKGTIRVAEFGVGYAADKSAARGVIILPLGILLESGVSMKIDDGKPVVFKVRYCLTDGCFSYVNLDDAILNSMKKGKSLNFEFKSAEGKNVNLIMKLNGFEKALREIQA